MLSVDPAELDPAVLALPNVVHIRQVIQAATGVLHDLLAEATPPTSKSEEIDGEEGGSCADSGGNTGGASGTDTISPSPAASLPSVGSVASAGPKLGAITGLTEAGKGAELVVSDMNAEPTVVADVLLSAMAAGLARPGAVLVATFKDFCGRQKKMRDEVILAVARLQAGTAARRLGDGCGGGAGKRAGDDDGAVVVEGSEKAGASVGFTGGSTKAAVAPLPAASLIEGERQAGPEGMVTTAMAGAGGWWRLVDVKTMKLLAGGQTEVTIVARVAYGDVAGMEHPSGKVVDGPATRSSPPVAIE